MAASRAWPFAFVLSHVGTAGAEPCAPRAELGGSAEAVARVATELRRLGVTAVAVNGELPAMPVRGGCPVVVAAVELEHDGGIAVAVRDRSQRSEGRVVSDAALAAAWIDSWLRDDLGEPPGAVEPASAPPPAPNVVEDAAPAPSVLERFWVAASFTQTWTDDRSRWSGIAAAACGRTGAFCLGARIAYAAQDVVAGVTAASRSDLSLLATVSTSQEIGRMSVAPEVGVGVGRLTTDRLDGCKLPQACDPLDPACVEMMPPCTNPDGTVYVGDGFHTTTLTPRAAAALRLAVPLFDHVWLDGLAALTFAPLSHTESYPPDGTVVPLNVAPGDLSLPGEPLLGVQLGIGLRVGAR